MEVTNLNYQRDLVIQSIISNADDYRRANKLSPSGLVYVRVPPWFAEIMTGEDFDELNRQDILVEVIEEGEDQ